MWCYFRYKQRATSAVAEAKTEFSKFIWLNFHICNMICYFFITLFNQIINQISIKQMVKLDTHSSASWVIFYFIQTHFSPSETILEFLKTKTILLLSFCMAYTGKNITKGNSHSFHEHLSMMSMFWLLLSHWRFGAVILQWRLWNLHWSHYKLWWCSKRLNRHLGHCGGNRRNSWSVHFQYAEASTLITLCIMDI